jgi:hypothetical protein
MFGQNQSLTLFLKGEFRIHVFAQTASLSFLDATHPESAGRVRSFMFHNGPKPADLTTEQIGDHCAKVNHLSCFFVLRSQGKILATSSPDFAPLIFF